ncbi:DUF4835 family protein, partial [Klebsiella pneumoniae]|uniref:type IX secretion component PorD family protein n=1 Tax=Klebsiella pneumoniae TaxID=573 RepID=UPI00385547FF
YNRDNPNTLILQFFTQGKTSEIIGIFKKGTGEDKAKAIELMAVLDVVNSAKYKDELQ